MKKMPYGLGLLVCVTLAACSQMPDREKDAGAVRVQIEARSGSSVSGWATLRQLSAETVEVNAQVSGLTPGEHGFHVHELGDCSAPDAMSTKGHFNPEGHQHGGVKGVHHLGDMPNLVADAAGSAQYRATVQGVSLAKEGRNTLLGRSLVVHADPDDYVSQPAGNAGKRVGCGVIRG